MRKRLVISSLNAGKRALEASLHSVKIAVRFTVGENNRRIKQHMEHYAGLDVSLRLTAICVLDERGSDCLRCQAVPMDPAAMTAPPRAAENGEGRLCQEDAKASCRTRDEGRSFGAVL
jgi:hypothetical protein